MSFQRVRSSSVLIFGEIMNKKVLILFAIMTTAIIPCHSMDEEFWEDFRESNKRKKSNGEALIDGFVRGAIAGLKLREENQRQYLQEQYLAQQIAYQEMLLRQEEERQRQIAMHYYIHSKHKKPTADERKTADKITEDLNKN